MKLYAPLLVLMLAAPAFAQTATDSAADDADAALAMRTGTVFFSDEAMTTMRAPDEIKTQWGSMAAEDQTAMRARCEAMTQAAITMEPSKGDGSGDQGTAGSEESTEMPAANDSTGTTAPEDMGYMGDMARMQPICDMIKTY